MSYAKKVCNKSVVREVDFSKMSDEELMDLLKEGVVVAFNILVDRYTKIFMSALRQFTSNYQDREDLIQEVFLKIFRNRHSYNSTGAKFSTWATRILKNQAIDFYRKRSRKKEIPVVQEAGVEEFELILYSNTPDPDMALERDDLIVVMQNCIRELPDKHKEALVLRDLQELSYNDIATITGLGLNTVKSRILRGREVLRVRMLEKLQEEIPQPYF